MAVVFIAFLKHISAMLFGSKPEGVEPGEDDLWLVIPSLIFLGLIIILSFYFGKMGGGNSLCLIF